MLSRYSYFRQFSTPIIFVSFEEIIFWCLLYLRCSRICIPRKLKFTTLSVLMSYIQSLG